MHGDGFAIAIVFILIVIGSIYLVIYMKKEFDAEAASNPVETSSPVKIEQKSPSESAAEDGPPKKPSLWSTVGFIWIFLSFIGSVWAFTMKTSVPVDALETSYVNNIGLMHQQMMIYIGSIGSFIAGIVAISTGAILKTLSAQ